MKDTGELPNSPTYKAGDRVLVEGTIDAPPDEYGIAQVNQDRTKEPRTRNALRDKVW